MNYKIQVQVWLGTQRRDTVWCIIGGELWHESSVFRFVDYRALALIMQKLQVNKRAFPMTLETRRYGATDEYEGSIPSLVTNKLNQTKWVKLLK